jgi:apolipoprotein N-acyltransferase
MNTMQTTTAVAPRDRTWRRRARLGSVVATVVAALGLWAVYVAFGIDLRSPAFGEYGGTAAVGAGNVAFVSALAAFTAWGPLAVLERLTPRARRMWLVIAVLALVASLGGPWSGTGITTANRVELMGFHLVVGAALIPLLYRTSAKPAASSRGGRDEHRTEATGTREAAA